MRVADALDLGPIAFGRDDDAARALNGFGDKGRDPVFAQMRDHLFQLACARDAKGFGRHVAAFGIPMRLIDMHDIGDRQAALFMHRRHAAQARAAHGRSVIGVAPADDHALFRLAKPRPIFAHDADVGVIRLGPRACEKDTVQIAGGQFGEFGGKGDGGRVAGLKKCVVERQIAHLPRGDIGQFGAAITDVDAPEARHRIEELVAIAIPQAHAVRAGDDARALCRQPRRMGEGVHVVRGIKCLQLGGRHVVGDRGHVRLRLGTWRMS
jgi:hypothetical protein